MPGIGQLEELWLAGQPRWGCIRQRLHPLFCRASSVSGHPVMGGTAKGAGWEFRVPWSCPKAVRARQAAKLNRSGAGFGVWLFAL